MPKKRILVADDEAPLRTMLTKALERAGYEVIAVKDGMEASLQIEREAYDLIITDYAMPNLNGLELVRRIKAKYPCLPIIVISGAGPVDDLLRSGALTFIEKPFIIQDVLTVVQSIFDLIH
jgi:DNA-binding NtrC family response regulator